MATAFDPFDDMRQQELIAAVAKSISELSRLYTLQNQTDNDIKTATEAHNKAKLDLDKHIKSLVEAQAA